MEFPDPILTANIYCSGKIDELLHAVVAPFWWRFKESDPQGQCYLWVMRYSRCGEHLKVRLHGPAGFAGEMRRRLTAAVERYFATLAEPPPEQRSLCESLFAVDPEDEAVTLYPDRSLLWTRYRRIPGTMGREPLSDDLRLAALFTRCLGSGSEIVLREFVPDEDGVFPHRRRTSLVNKFFILGLTGLGFSPAQAAEYLAYHRDWLILAHQDDPRPMRELFAKRAAGMAPAVETLREVIDARHRGTEDLPPGFARWTADLKALFDHVLALAGDLCWAESLYMRDQVYAPVFKSIHGLANQARVGLYNEAFLCHLLAQAFATAAIPTDLRTPEPMDCAAELASL
jgi:lantibiotic biosynthesis dehydratase-like protein